MSLQELVREKINRDAKLGASLFEIVKTDDRTFIGSNIFSDTLTYSTHKGEIFTHIRKEGGEVEVFDQNGEVYESEALPCSIIAEAAYSLIEVGAVNGLSGDYLRSLQKELTKKGLTLRLTLPKDTSCPEIHIKLPLNLATTIRRYYPGEALSEACFKLLEIRVSETAPLAKETLLPTDTDYVSVTVQGRDGLYECVDALLPHGYKKDIVGLLVEGLDRVECSHIDALYATLSTLEKKLLNDLVDQKISTDLEKLEAIAGQNA